MARVEFHQNVLDDLVEGPIGAETLRITDGVAAQARRSAPVRTGRLRESIRARRTGGQGEASLDVDAANAGVPYARFVEYGTRHAPAQPFIQPAVRETETHV